MNMMLVLGRGASRAYINAPVRMMTPGTTYTRYEGKTYGVPLLVLEYDTATLKVLTLLFEAMATAEENPVVHLWDLDRGDPEAAVVFRKSAMADPISRDGVTLPPVELVAFAEANLGQQDAHELIRRFRETKCFAIYIYDLSQHRQGAPLHKFVTMELERKAPASPID